MLFLIGFILGVFAGMVLPTVLEMGEESRRIRRSKP